MITQMIKPDCAIVVDVTHDTSTPLMDASKEGDLKIGLGPAITKAPPIHTNMRNLLSEVAKENNIPYQIAVVAKETGTDADAVAYQNDGTPVCLISLPLRYMHTTVETMHKDDIENTIRLIYHSLIKLKPDFNFYYL
jgi:putative aminopeptidase FrvX